jgi:hypothetical protein
MLRVLQRRQHVTGLCGADSRHVDRLEAFARRHDLPHQHLVLGRPLSPHGLGDFLAEQICRCNQPQEMIANIRDKE